MLVVFDVNETIIDVRPLESIFSSHAGRDGLLEEWFAALVQVFLVSAATGEYRDFARLRVACAKSVGEAHGVEVTDAALEDLVDGMRSLPAFPDVKGGMAALREAGHRLVALPNSPHSLADPQLTQAGVADLLHRVYSAEDAKVVKPAREAYRYVLDKEGFKACDAVMVAAHDWDIAAAQSLGMRSVFVARGNFGGRRPLPGWPAPDALVSSLAGVADVVAKLDSSARRECS